MVLVYLFLTNHDNFSLKRMFIFFTYKTLRGSSTGPILGVLPNDHQFESPQSHLPKAKPCDYRGTRASRVLRVLLRLVEVRVSMKRQPGHPRLSKYIYIYIYISQILENNKVTKLFINKINKIAYQAFGPVVQPPPQKSHPYKRMWI